MTDSRSMFIFGIDVGTSSLKTGLYEQTDNAIRTIGTARRDYEIIRRDGFVEQRPDDWYAAIRETVNELGSEIPGDARIKIGMSTQGATLVLMDRDDRPMGNAVSWLDAHCLEPDHPSSPQRSDDEMWRITGWPGSTFTCYSKLLWFRAHQPERLENVAIVGDCSSYLHARLAGNRAIDPTNAAITQFYDVTRGGWSDDLTRDVELDFDSLPRCVAPGASLGRLLPDVSTELGLPADTEVFAAGHDQYCGALGAGLLPDSQVLLSLGTAWVVLALTALEPLRIVESTPSGVAIGPSLTSGVYGLLQTVPGAGERIFWALRISEAVTRGESTDETAESSVAPSSIDSIPPGAEGLGVDVRDDRGFTLRGLNSSHTPRHFLRAMVEHSSLELCREIDILEKAGRRIDTIMVSGGGGRFPSWLRVLSDMSERELTVLPDVELACRGAAMLAAGDMFTAKLAKDGKNEIDAAAIRVVPETKRSVQYAAMVDTMRNQREGR